MGRYFITALATLAVLGGVCFALYWVPYMELELRDPARQIAAEKRLEIVVDSRRSWGQALGGLLLVGSFWVGIWKLGVTKRGQVTDRFLRASEQLGSDREAVRLAGVYALGRLVKDSEGERDTVQTILAAFVRGATHTTRPTRRRSGATTPPKSRRISGDVQAALDVLFRSASDVLPAFGVDLARCDLRGANMKGARLAGIDFSEALLDGACMAACSGEDLSFKGASLIGVEAKSCRLTDTDFRNASLERADLAGAELTMCRFDSAKMQRSDFSQGTVESCVFEGANLADAHFVATTLSGANLAEADLSRADLRQAALANAFLTLAKLDGVDFSGARLDGADLRDADLRSVRGLDASQMRSARVDRTTKLPPGMPSLE